MFYATLLFLYTPRQPNWKELFLILGMALPFQLNTTTTTSTWIAKKGIEGKKPTFFIIVSALFRISCWMLSDKFFLPEIFSFFCTGRRTGIKLNSEWNNLKPRVICTYTYTVINGQRWKRIKPKSSITKLNVWDKRHYSPLNCCVGRTKEKHRKIALMINKRSNASLTLPDIFYILEIFSLLLSLTHTQINVNFHLFTQLISCNGPQSAYSYFVWWFFFFIL